MTAEQKQQVKELLTQAQGMGPNECLHLLQLDQRQRWLAGNRLPAEVYVDLLQEFGFAGCCFDAIYAEYLLRDELGEQPSMAEYEGRFPAFGRQLRQQAELHRALGSDSSAETRESLAPYGQTAGFPALPGYDIVCELGKGAMGTVYQAYHRSLARTVALKVIHKERVATQEAVLRFQREAQAVARLSHPNIVTVHDAGQVGELHYFTMELIDGIDLERLVTQKGPLAVATACNYARQVALGLQHAFERGMVHRDIKPANLIVTPPPSPNESTTSLVKILDMGLVRFDAQDNAATLTQDGSMVGTPNYMAPEQTANPHQVDIRADIYSLGCTLYFLLVGRVPFPGRTVIETLDMHRWLAPQSLERMRSSLPAGLNEIVRKMMAKRPTDRYATPAEAADALEPYTRPGGPPPAAKPPLPASALKETKRVRLPGELLLKRKQESRPMLNLGAEMRHLKQELANRIETNDLPRAKAIVERLLRNNPADSDAVAAREFLNAALPTDQILLGCQILKGHMAAVLCVAVIDSERVVSGGEDGTLFVWNLKKGEVVAKLAGQVGPVRSVAATGQQVLSAGEDKSIRLWDLASGSEIRRYMGYRGPVNGVAFAPDGRRAGSASRDRTVHIWELGTGKQLHAISRHSSEVLAVAFSPKSGRIASASRDSTVRTSSVRDGRQTARIDKSPARLTCVAFAPDDDWLAFGGSDNCLYLWDLNAEKELARFLGHKDCVTAVAFAPDGRRLLSASADKTVRLWDVKGSELLCRTGHDDEVTAVVFSANGKSAISASRDKTLRVWQLPP